MVHSPSVVSLNFRSFLCGDTTFPTVFSLLTVGPFLSPGLPGFFEFLYLPLLFCWRSQKSMSPPPLPFPSLSSPFGGSLTPDFKFFRKSEIIAIFAKVCFLLLKTSAFLFDPSFFFSHIPRTNSSWLASSFLVRQLFKMATEPEFSPLSPIFPGICSHHLPSPPLKRPLYPCNPYPPYHREYLGIKCDHSNTLLDFSLCYSFVLSFLPTNPSSVCTFPPFPSPS